VTTLTAAEFRALKPAIPAYTMTGASPDECWSLVRDFHYSRRMPSNMQHCFAWRRPGGLFGDYGEPVAVAIYGQPVNRSWPTDALELQRLVRRDDFDGRLSDFLSWSLGWLRSHTNRPFVVSYADSGKGHHGGIYQATNWKFVRETGRYQDGVVSKSTGEYIHGRQCNRMFGSRSLETLKAIPGDFEPAYHETKYLYVYPIRQQLKPLLKRFGWESLPYPKPNAARPVDERDTIPRETGATPVGRSKFVAPPAPEPKQEGLF
jgi:hypothetical protein